MSIDSVAPEIRQQGAVQFKNFVKYNWEPKEQEDGVKPACIIQEGEKDQIRQNIVDLMLNAPDKVRAQISEALTIISEHDFPWKWSTLLPSILERLKSEDPKTLNGVLSTTDSIFRRYRGQFMTGALSRELEYCQQIIRPMLEVAQRVAHACVSLSSAAVGSDAAAAAPVTLDNARLVLCVFYSLNSPGLTDEFESTLKEWMDCIHLMLTLNIPCVKQTDPEEESPLDAVKARSCECLSLFMEKNEEEFADYLETFVGDVWKELIGVGQGTGQDSLAMAAITFLTTVARSVHYKLFAGADILKQVCQGVIIPNIRLREGDIELFEMNWVEYVRRDTEGSDSDTRRRAASELVKSLVEKFPVETTELFTGYVASLLSEAAANPANAWQAKDAAIYLVTALAAKTKTVTAGATTTNELVNLQEFYGVHIAPELANANVDDRNIIKADCLRFVTIFRSQLPKSILLEMFPKCVEFLSNTHNVVHSYAATLVERLLAMRQDGKAIFSAEELASYLQTLLEKLFAALTLPESGENEYVMRCVMRLVAFVGHAVTPVAIPALTELAKILGNVARNPTQPGFNHYLFESIAALVKYGCDGKDDSCSSIEGIVFPPFQIILQEDVQEFHPYVFQIFAQMIEARHSASPMAPIPESYIQLLQPLLTPHFWERTGNVPALGRLLRAYIDASPKQVEGHLQGILGVFQKLVASKSHDHEGMLILDYVLGRIEPETMKPYMGSIWTILYQRLQTAKTNKFCKCFVSTASLYSALRGGSMAGDSMDSVQHGILAMLVQSVWAPTLAAPGIITNQKAAVIGSTRLICESKVMQQPGAAKASAQLLHAVAARVLGTTDVHSVVNDTADEVDEFAGYSAAYAKLSYSDGKEKDWMSAVGDEKSDVAQRLIAFNAHAPGILAGLAQNLSLDEQGLVSQLFQQIGLK